MINGIMLMLAAAGTPQVNQPAESSQSAGRYRDMMKEMMKSAKEENPGKTEKKEDGKPCTKEASEESGEDGKKPDNDMAAVLPEGMGMQSLLWIQRPVEEITVAAADEGQQDMAPVTAGKVDLLLQNEEVPLQNEPVEKEKPESPGNAQVSIVKEDSSVNPGEPKKASVVPDGAAQKLPSEAVSGKEEAADKKVRQVLPDTARPAEPQKMEPQQTEPPAELVRQTSAPVVQDNVPLPEAGGKTEEMTGTVSAEQTEKMFQKLPQDLTVRLSAGEREFSVQLEPENLGKLIIKASYEQGKATISIICTNEKTLQFLSGHAGELGSIMENSLGTPTNIVLDKAPQDYLNQEQNGQNGQQNEPDNSGKEKKDQHKKNDGQNFLQQLRLGLI